MSDGADGGIWWDISHGFDVIGCFGILELCKIFVIIMKS